MLAHDYSRCLECLIQRLIDKGADRFNFPTLDPERPVYNLVNLYHAVMDVFVSTVIHVILHNHFVYVAMLSIEVGKTPSSSSLTRFWEAPYSPLLSNIIL